MDAETKSELDSLVSLARKYLWAGPEIHRYIQAHNIALTQAGFYSPVASVEEIEQSFEYGPDKGFYWRADLFDDARLGAVLRELSAHSAEFDPPMDGSTDTPSGFFWNNGMFSWSDAMSYYSFIRARKPRRIVEIGSGFSTLAAREAVSRNGFGRITCIEPFPRPWLEELPGIELIRDKAQNIPLSFFNRNLDDGDILFIDSSHSVKIGSDCLYIYLHILPALTARLLIHAHDVFLPYPQPRKWALERQIFWTEQYLLMAYLLDNPRTEVVFPSAYNAKAFPAEMAAFMHGRAKAGGGSFWFTRDGAGPCGGHGG